MRKAAPAYLHVVSPRMFIGQIQVYTTDAAVRRPASQGILLTRLVNGAVQRLEGSVRCSQGRTAVAGPEAVGGYWVGSQGFRWPLNDGLSDGCERLKNAGSSTEERNGRAAGPMRAKSSGV